MRGPVVCFIAAVFLLGCGACESRDASPVVESRDSSGVRIVTIRGDLAGIQAPYVGLEEEYELGAEPGGELYRVNDAAFLPSGQLVLANSGVPEAVPGILIEADGEVGGSVRLPPNGETLASQGPRYAVLTTDDLDVQLVIVHRLRDRGVGSEP